MSNSLSPEDLAWLRQCAAVDGNTYDRVLLHLLERVEALEAAQQQPHQGKLDQLIAQNRADDKPTPEAAPVATLSDALISAEAALSDIAEGEETNTAPNSFVWAEQRCAEALATIRPVMQQHGILTSEHLSPAKPAPPAAPAGGLVERVCGEMAGDDDPSIDAHAAIREVAAWLDRRGQHGCSLLLREETDQ
jgi:hypothetical protein